MCLVYHFEDQRDDHRHDNARGNGRGHRLGGEGVPEGHRDAAGNHIDEARDPGEPLRYVVGEQRRAEQHDARLSDDARPDVLEQAGRQEVELFTVERAVLRVWAEV